MRPIGAFVVDLFGLLVIAFNTFGPKCIALAKLPLGEGIFALSRENPKEFTLTDKSGKILNVKANGSKITLETGEELDLIPFAHVECPPILIGGHQIRIEYRVPNWAHSGHPYLMYTADGNADAYYRLQMLLYANNNLRLIHTDGYTVVAECSMLYCVCRDEDRSLVLYNKCLTWPGRMGQLIHDIMAKKPQDTIDVSFPYDFSKVKYGLISHVSKCLYTMTFDHHDGEKLFLIGKSVVVLPNNGELYTVEPQFHLDLNFDPLNQKYLWVKQIPQIIPLDGGYCMFISTCDFCPTILISEAQIGKVTTSNGFDLIIGGATYYCTNDDIIVDLYGNVLATVNYKLKGDYPIHDVHHLDNAVRIKTQTGEEHFTILFDDLPKNWEGIHMTHRIFKHGDGHSFILIGDFGPQFICVRGWVELPPNQQGLRTKPALRLADVDD